MKCINLCIAVILSLALGLAAVPADSFAKDTATGKTQFASSKASSKEKMGPVNINTATREDLQMLPGVGPKTADAILEYRKANGKFKSANDLLAIKGIGEKTLKKMRPLLKL